MRLDANAMRWVSIGFAITLVVTSALTLYYISSPEPQLASETENGAAPGEKPEVVQISKPTAGAIRPSPSSQDFQTDKSTSEPVSSDGCDLPPLTGSRCLVRETGHLASQEKGIGYVQEAFFSGTDHRSPTRGGGASGSGSDGWRDLPSDRDIGTELLPLAS